MPPQNTQPKPHAIPTKSRTLLQPLLIAPLVVNAISSITSSHSAPLPLLFPQAITLRLETTTTIDPHICLLSVLLSKVHDPQLLLPEAPIVKCIHPLPT